MRTPDINIHRRALSGIQSNLRGIDRAANEIALGKRLIAPSDDPSNARSILRAARSSREADQFIRNIERAKALTALEDEALQQLGNALVRGRELALSQGGSDANAESRQIAAKEAAELVSFLQDLGNTRMGDRYVFGGSRPTTPPFPPGHDPADPLPDGEIRLEIGPDRTLAPNQSADRVFGESGALTALQSLVAALETNDTEGIRQAAEALDEAHGRIQVLAGATGSRMNQMELAESRLDSARFAATELRSNLEDVDLVEAISRLGQRQNAYESALAVTARVLGTGLVDYLR